MGGESKRRRGGWLPINHAISTRTRECRSLKDLAQTVASLALKSYTIAEKPAAHLRIEYGAANIIPSPPSSKPIHVLPVLPGPFDRYISNQRRTSRIRVIVAAASRQCSRGPALET